LLDTIHAGIPSFSILKFSSLSCESIPATVEDVQMSFFDRLVSSSAGKMSLLALAAFLEAWGDSFFQVCFYRASGAARILAFVTGALVLAAYGSVVNLPRWDFGKLIGVYVVLFFVIAQIIARVRFGQTPTMPIYAGGTLIVLGGLVIAFWQA
jgi:hypothetical protein